MNRPRASRAGPGVAGEAVAAGVDGAVAAGFAIAVAAGFAIAVAAGFAIAAAAGFAIAAAAGFAIAVTAGLAAVAGLTGVALCVACALTSSGNESITARVKIERAAVRVMTISGQ